MQKLSGRQCIRILCNKFGFKVARTRGSHVVLRKDSIGTVVPLHREIKQGTLKGILKLARIGYDQFIKNL